VLRIDSGGRRQGRRREERTGNPLEDHVEDDDNDNDDDDEDDDDDNHDNKDDNDGRDVRDLGINGAARPSEG